jgi:hypothetical protein
MASRHLQRCFQKNQTHVITFHNQDSPKKHAGFLKAFTKIGPRELKRSFCSESSKIYQKIRQKF